MQLTAIYDFLVDGTKKEETTRTYQWLLIFFATMEETIKRIRGRGLTKQQLEQQERAETDSQGWGEGRQTS